MKNKQKLDNTKYRILLLAGGVLLLAAGIITAQFEKKGSPTVNYQKQPIEKDDNLLNANWKYMPGVQKTENGLEVQPLDTSIVDQEGKVVQKNLPINLAGTHIENLKGDFSVISKIDLQDSASGTIQLYGNVPIIADEFRIERESIQVAVTKSSLVVKVWDGTNQNPTAVREFKYTPAGTMQLTIQKKSNIFTFIVNKQEVGTINDPGIFKLGKIWFGLDAQDKAWGLQSLELKNNSFVLADGATIKVDHSSTESLQQLANKKRQDFTIGSAMALGPLVSDPQYAKAALSDFGGMTPENDMKMINLQPKRGVYSFAKADALVQIAEQNNMKVHGHALVFGEANPAWFNQLPAATQNEKDVIENIMNDHIETVVGHFGNKINSWDVINEPLADYDEFEEGQLMRNTKWYQAMGEDFIIEALDTAHNTNPNARLFINEFGLEDDGERWDAMVALLTRLKPQLEERGIPVKQVGVGFQSHIYESEDKVDPQILKKHLQQLQKLGYIAQVSEQDVFSGDGDRVQAEQYASVLQTCLSEANCVAWRIWILSDRYNFWKDDDSSIKTGIDGLYGSDMLPRPGYKSVKQLLSSN